jgi:hypothetical protein
MMNTAETGLTGEQDSRDLGSTGGLSFQRSAVLCFPPFSSVNGNDQGI